MGNARAVRVAICCTADPRGEQRQLRGYLTAAGFTPLVWRPVDDAIDWPASAPADALILTFDRRGTADEGADAVALVRRLRACGCAAPVLVIDSIAAAQHAAAVLEAGADDYIRAPYDAIEVVARVRVLLRRSCLLTWLGDAHRTLALDRCRHVIIDGELEVPLTPREAALLECLAQRSGEVVTRDELAARVWGLVGRGRTPTNIVDVYVAYLRRKLKTLGQGSLIRSVRGVGYELTVPHDTPVSLGAEANLFGPPPAGETPSPRAAHRRRSDAGERRVP